jgi:hypothetical protein
MYSSVKGIRFGNNFIYLLQVLSNNNKVGNPTIKSVTRTIKLVTGLLFMYNKVVNSGF